MTRLAICLATRRRLCVRYSWVVLVLLVVSYGAPIHASPTHEESNYYYDCALNEVGWQTHACNNQWYGQGTLEGAYRWEVIMGCSEFDFSAQWYYWDGTYWVPSMDLRDQTVDACC